MKLDEYKLFVGIISNIAFDKDQIFGFVKFDLKDAIELVVKFEILNKSVERHTVFKFASLIVILNDPVGFTIPGLRMKLN